MRCQKSPLWCRLTYGEEFSKIKPSGHMYDTKCIFSAHIMCMVHTPFNGLMVASTIVLKDRRPKYSIVCTEIRTVRSNLAVVMTTICRQKVH